MLQIWIRQCYKLLLMIVKSDSFVREFDGDDQDKLILALRVLDRHL